MKNKLVGLVVTNQDKKYHRVVFKIAEEKDFAQNGLTRSTVYRIRDEFIDDGVFWVDKKPASGRIYKPVKSFPTLNKALIFIERCVWIASPEYRHHANEALKMSAEKMNQRIKEGEGGADAAEIERQLGAISYLINKSEE